MPDLFGVKSRTGLSWGSKNPLCISAGLSVRIEFLFTSMRSVLFAF